MATRLSLPVRRVRTHRHPHVTACRKRSRRSSWRTSTLRRRRRRRCLCSRRRRRRRRTRRRRRRRTRRSRRRRTLRRCPALCLWGPRRLGPTAALPGCLPALAGGRSGRRRRRRRRRASRTVELQGRPLAPGASRQAATAAARRRSRRRPRTAGAACRRRRMAGRWCGCLAPAANGMPASESGRAFQAAPAKSLIDVCV